MDGAQKLRKGILSVDEEPDGLNKIFRFVQKKSRTDENSCKMPISQEILNFIKR